MIMAVLILVSTFGCNNGLILAGARVYYAMARDGLFFRRAGGIQQGACALVLAPLRQQLRRGTGAFRVIEYGSGNQKLVLALCSVVGIAVPLDQASRDPPL